VFCSSTAPKNRACELEKNTTFLVLKWRWRVARQKFWSIVAWAATNLTEKARRRQFRITAIGTAAALLTETSSIAWYFSATYIQQHSRFGITKDINYAELPAAVRQLVEALGEFFNSSGSLKNVNVKIIVEGFWRFANENETVIVEFDPLWPMVDVPITQMPKYGPPKAFNYTILEEKEEEKQ
jgi:hypothetical protein